MIIVPSILSDSLEVIQTQIERIKTETSLRQVQIDIVDPDFAPEVTIHPIDMLEVDTKELEIDVHLMTNDPINDVIECSQISGIHTIIAQIERMPSQRAFYDHVQSLKIQTGLSLDLYTPVDAIDPEVLNQLALIQVMGNKAGKQGQAFAGEPILEKVRSLHAMRTKIGAAFLIAVDIGMTPDNAKLVEQAGADMVTPGSFLWNAPNLQNAIEAYSQKL